MNHAALLRRIDGLANRRGQVEDFVHGEARRPDVLIKHLSGNVIHHKVETPIDRTALVNGHDVGVRDRGTNLGEKREQGILVALGLWGEEAKEAPPQLVAVLGDDGRSNYLRQSAVTALSRLGPTVLQPLIKALEDPDVERRCEAAYALGRIGATAETAVPALRPTPIGRAHV